MLLETLIFQKTDLGRVELASRILGLSNELRLVLVLIDGRRDVAALSMLSAKVAASHDCLEELMALGVIEVIGESGSAPEPSRSNAAMPSPAMPSPAMPSPGTPNITTASAIKSYAQTPAASTQNYASTAQRLTPTPVAPSHAPSANVLQARAQLSAEIARLLGKDARAACDRLQEMRSREELLEALPKLVNLVALYGYHNEAQRIRVTILNLLATA
jgi:hypothetical protein